MLLVISTTVKWSQIMIIDHLARTAPAEDHHRIVAAMLRPPAEWRRPAGRPRTTWLRTLDEDVQPQNFEFTLPGGRPRIGTSGDKSSVGLQQLFDRSSPRRKKIK